jgi:hypothetical protein
MFSCAETLAISSRVVTVSVAVRVRSSVAEIAGKGCYNSGFILRVTGGDFYAPTRLDFESASCSDSEGGEWQTRVPAKERWLMGC